VDSIPPFGAAFSRVFIGSVLLHLYSVIFKYPYPKSKKLVFKISLIGLFNFGLPWACLFWGEQYVQPALASIINSTVPLFVLTFSWFMLPDEKPTFLKGIGVLLGFLGIVSIFAPSISFDHLSDRHLWGMFAVMMMSIFYGLGGILSKKVVRKIEISWNITIQGYMGSLFLLILSLSTEGYHWFPKLLQYPKATGGILYLAIFSTAIAWLLFYRLIREWGAVRSSTVTYVAPFVAILVDWLYYKKFPTLPQMLGAALIFSGLYLIHLARVSELPVTQHQKST
jgi:drug/metabolite transporter (DMT)-like permease